MRYQAYSDALGVSQDNAVSGIHADTLRYGTDRSGKTKEVAEASKVLIMSGEEGRL